MHFVFRLQVSQRPPRELSGPWNIPCAATTSHNSCAYHWDAPVSLMFGGMPAQLLRPCIPPPAPRATAWGFLRALYYTLHNRSSKAPRFPHERAFTGPGPGQYEAAPAPWPNPSASSLGPAQTSSFATTEVRNCYQLTSGLLVLSQCTSHPIFPK